MFKVHGKNDLAACMKKLAAGAAKHFPAGGASISIGGVAYAPAALTQVLQDFVDQRDAVEAARALTKARLQVEEARAPAQLAVARDFERFVRGMFGNAPDVLADFGLDPLKSPTPATAEQKAVAAARRRATRKARHTMGSRQKKGVKGAIDARLVVTPEEPAATDEGGQSLVATRSPRTVPS